MHLPVEWGGERRVNRMNLMMKMKPGLRFALSSQWSNTGGRKFPFIIPTIYSAQEVKGFAWDCILYGLRLCGLSMACASDDWIIQNESLAKRTQNTSTWATIWFYRMMNELERYLSLLTMNFDCSSVFWRGYQIFSSDQWSRSRKIPYRDEHVRLVDAGKHPLYEIQSQADTALRDQSNV